MAVKQKELRADLFLSQNGYTPSRSRAKQLIDAGNVYINDRMLTKPSAEIEETDKVELRGNAVPYVSRGGLKLQAALDEFIISPADMICVDIGASSGGFTDCLLQRGAKRIYAIDSGHGQLAPSLIADERVVSVEGFNARNLTIEVTGGEMCDMAVMDVSFISQTLLYQAISTVLRDDGYLISLIKPQFEVGRGNLGKNGIVRDEKVRQEAKKRVVDSATAQGYTLIGLIESPIKGGDGNIEYLAAFRKS